MTHNERPPLPLERAVPDLARLPRHPGPQARPVLCQGRKGACRRTLGVVDGGYLFQRHQGRETVASLPAEVRCESCGTYARVGLAQAA